MDNIIYVREMDNLGTIIAQLTRENLQFTVMRVAGLWEIHIKGF